MARVTLATTVTLSLWVLPTFDPAGSAGEGLAAALLEFQAGRPGITVATRVREESGPASVVGYLETGGRIAPDLLPDVVMLPLQSLPQVAAQDLLEVPGNAERTVGTYPFAAALATASGQAMAVPFGVDVVHAIGLDAQPPTNWAEAQERSFAASLGPGPAGLAPVLVWAGAIGADSAAAPLSTITTELAGFVGTARGAAWGDSAVTATPRGALSAFLNEELEWAVVSGAALAPVQSAFPGIAWGPLPGPTGPVRPMAWGWALAIPKGGRVTEASALIDHLTAPANRGWIAAAGALPAWPALDRPGAAVAEAVPSVTAAYAEFVEAQLAQAFAPPPDPILEEWLRWSSQYIPQEVPTTE